MISRQSIRNSESDEMFDSLVILPESTAPCIVKALLPALEFPKMCRCANPPDSAGFGNKFMCRLSVNGTSPVVEGKATKVTVLFPELGIAVYHRVCCENISRATQVACHSNRRCRKSTVEANYTLRAPGTDKNCRKHHVIPSQLARVVGISVETAFVFMSIADTGALLPS